MNGRRGIAISGNIAAKASRGHQLHLAAIERDAPGRTRVGFAAWPVKRSNRAAASATSARNHHQVDQSQRAVGMRQPARLPHRVLGAMRQIWMRPSAIAPRSSRTTVKAAMSGPAHGFDRTLKLHQRPHGKARLGQPPVRALGVGDRECGEMHAGMAGQRRIELAPERRVGGLEQHLDIAAAEHGGDVAGAGRRAVGVGLHRHRRRRKARARQRRGWPPADRGRNGRRGRERFRRQPAAGGRLLLPMRDLQPRPAPSCRGCLSGRSVSI